MKNNQYAISTTHDSVNDTLNQSDNSPRQYQGNDSGPTVPEAKVSQDIPSFKVPGHIIRVALKQNIRRAQISSVGQFDIVSNGASRVSMRGTLTLEQSSSGIITCSIPFQAKKEYVLPCTLSSNNALNVINFNGAGYRGSMIIAASGEGSFSVINFCDVEDYLRGVVPLEIGNGVIGDIEAIKAQAIAARTYTYKKIIERRNQSFDILPTISDQVYGGVSVESPVCNLAVKKTDGLVIVYKDSLIYAYYHSTCGGKTANVEDVWDMKALPYLRSIADCDENGRAYCSGSASFTWEESWPVSQLSGIINKFSKDIFPKSPCLGKLKEIVIDASFACGRTKNCRIETSKGSFSCGGDKVRFVLRRKLNGFPILRSSIITGISMSGGIIRLTGRGYGHGIGMCQFGAIGRARAGQTYEQILKAYYTGVEICNISAPVSLSD
ncbi:MAG TPA: hypothetical protein DCO75_07295 [Fibrobacteres bacterium]|nr:hypothetical protein [Fibrobacterota bacterium]